MTLWIALIEFAREINKVDKWYITITQYATLLCLSTANTESKQTISRIYQYRTAINILKYEIQKGYFLYSW